MPDRPHPALRTLVDLRGPTRIVGGPRSGKTRQLQQLAVEWLAGGLDATRLVLVVRSRDGAALLRRRVEDEMPGAHPALRVWTHEQLARFVLEAGGGGEKPLAALSRTGEWMAMRAALHRAEPLPRLGPLVDEPSSTSDALAMASAFKRALVGPGLLAGRLRGAPESVAELAVVAASYERVLVEMGSRDHSDTHTAAIDALFADRALLQGWADLLLVDEAEDLSPAQWYLLRELGGRLTHPRRLVMAGHWTESTPGFRGVSSESSSRPFEEYFPAEMSPAEWALPSALPNWAEQVAASLGLESTLDPALDASTTQPPLLEAAFRIGPTATVWAAADETEEALAVAGEIARAHLQGELQFGDVAILVRSASRQLAPIKAALKRFAIPYRSLAEPGWAGHPLVAVALNWLSVLCLPGDDGVLLTALASGPRAVSPGAIRVIRQEAGRRGQSLQRVFWEWCRSEESSPLSGDASGAAEAAREQLRIAGRPWLALGPGDPGASHRELTWPQLRAILGQVEVAAGIATSALADLDQASVLSGFAKTAEAVGEVERRLGKAELTMGRWMAELQLAVRHAGEEAAPAIVANRSEVSLLTFRQAKGRSWPRVFICGCTDGSIPAPPETGGLLDPDEVQELVRLVPELEDVFTLGDRQRDAEARLFWVALTRASAEVTCSWARRELGRAAERSPFVGALLNVGRSGVSAPRAELAHPDDLTTELALASPASGLEAVSRQLARSAADLRQALAPWDPVADGTVQVGEPLSISATSVGAWLACPRQYLVHSLGSASDPEVDQTLGNEAHRLLELLYQDRKNWEGSPTTFQDRGGQLLRQRLMPEVRSEQSDPLDVVFIQLWLERLIRRWSLRIVTPGRERVGEPIAEEVAFTLVRGRWELRGQVDALWRHRDGELEVLDYKTTKTPSSDTKLREEVFGKPPEGPSRWQLPIYQIAAGEGAFSAQVGAELPSLARDWYVGADPGPRDPNPIAARGFRMVDGAHREGRPGVLTQGELERIDGELDKLAEVILGGRFPAQPRHSTRTCRDGHSGCAYSFWCDGEGSVGSQFLTPNPEL